MIFQSARMLIVSHQGSNTIMQMENSFFNLFISFEVVPSISISNWIVTRSESTKLQVVTSVSALDRWF
jgi:hypothetical protein